MGRLLIRAALTSLLQLSNNEIQLTRSEKGKPLLIRDGAIDNSMGFNVSHQVCVNMVCVCSSVISVCRVTMQCWLPRRVAQVSRLP